MKEWCQHLACPGAQRMTLLEEAQRWTGDKGEEPAEHGEVKSGPGY